MSIDNFIKSGVLVKQDSSKDEIADLLKKTRKEKLFHI